MSGSGENGAAALTTRLAGFFADLDFSPVEPAMLLPADVVLDHMGEDIRQRLLLTTAPDGTEFCLRPDFTLPIALWHIAHGAASGGRYSYSGYAFRFPSPGDPLRRAAEFRQVGIEDFSGGDAQRGDAEVVSAAMTALGEGGLDDITCMFGDVAIFGALIDALALGDAWAARLRRLFWRRSATGDIAAVLASSARTQAQNSDAALGRALARLDPADARAVIGEVMAIAGVGGAGGREASEIAARFAEQAREAEGEGPGPEVGALIERFLGIEVAAGNAAGALGDFAREASLDLGAPIAALERRLDLIAAKGVPVGEARFATAFGRRIEYYTGHVFEMRARGRGNLGPIASGGRYDGFLADLGAAKSLPAVGCSIYVDRLAAAGGRS